MAGSLAATNSTKRGNGRARGVRSTLLSDVKMPVPSNAPCKPKIRFYFEESDGSLTPIYGNRKFPIGPPIGFVQTSENCHGPAPKHPAFLRIKQ